MDKHTPGPWRYAIVHEEDGGSWILDEHGRYLMEAVCSDEESLFIKDGDEREANMRLAALAPTLLDALEGMVEEYDADQDGQDQVVANARAVIKEARRR
jgi:hypothetical protein